MEKSPLVRFVGNYFFCFLLFYCFEMIPLILLNRRFAVQLEYLFECDISMPRLIILFLFCYMLSENYFNHSHMKWFENVYKQHGRVVWSGVQCSL